MKFVTKIDIDLKGFVVPDYLMENSLTLPVAPGVSSRTARTFDLSEIPAETLDKMCYEFKREVFKRAGKSMLPIGGSGGSGGMGESL